MNPLFGVQKYPFNGHNRPDDWSSARRHAVTWTRRSTRRLSPAAENIRFGFKSRHNDDRPRRGVRAKRIGHGSPRARAVFGKLESSEDRPRRPYRESVRPNWLKSHGRRRGRRRGNNNKTPRHNPFRRRSGSRRESSPPPPPPPPQVSENVTRQVVTTILKRGRRRGRVGTRVGFRSPDTGWAVGRYVPQNGRKYIINSRESADRFRTVRVCRVFDKQRLRRARVVAHVRDLVRRRKPSAREIGRPSCGASAVEPAEEETVRKTAFDRYFCFWVLRTGRSVVVGLLTCRVGTSADNATVYSTGRHRVCETFPSYNTLARTVNSRIRLVSFLFFVTPSHVFCLDTKRSIPTNVYTLLLRKPSEHVVSVLV